MAKRVAVIQRDRINVTRLPDAPDQDQLTTQTQRLYTEILQRERRNDSQLMSFYLEFARLIARWLDAGHTRQAVAAAIAPLLNSETTQVRIARRDKDGVITPESTEETSPMQLASARVSRFIPIAKWIRGIYAKSEIPISEDNPVVVSGEKFYKATDIEKAANTSKSLRNYSEAITRAYQPHIRVDSRSVRDTLAVRAQKAVGKIQIKVAVMNSRGALTAVVMRPLKEAPPQAWLGALRAVLDAKPKGLRVPGMQDFVEGLPSIAGAGHPEHLSPGELVESS